MRWEESYRRFENLTYDDFRKLAKDPKLTNYEKIGFPGGYRRDSDSLILGDLKSKLKGLREKNKVILDVGCGCGKLAFMIINLCGSNKSKLLLVDSKEMLSLLPNRPFVQKFPCRFPDCAPLLEKYKGKIDTILIYSVLHYVFAEGNVFDFLDVACELLKAPGEMLIGDIPNLSKKRRFLSSVRGIKYHRKFMRTKEMPKASFSGFERQKIDDSIVMAILQRYRSSGFDTFLLPEDENLPLSNRREDILIRKP